MNFEIRTQPNNNKTCCFYCVVVVADDDDDYLLLLLRTTSSSSKNNKENTSSGMIPETKTRALASKPQTQRHPQQAQSRLNTACVALHRRREGKAFDSLRKKSEKKSTTIVTGSWKITLVHTIVMTVTMSAYGLPIQIICMEKATIAIMNWVRF